MKKYILCFVFVVLSLYGGYYAILFKMHDYNPDFISVDSCMDNGGCWDYTDKICRKEESNAQELCHRGIEERRKKREEKNKK